MGQMGSPDGDGRGGGGGSHPHHQYHYQALLAAVQNPTQGLHPFPLPFHVPLHHAQQGPPAAGKSLLLFLFLSFPTGCRMGMGWIRKRIRAPIPRATYLT